MKIKRKVELTVTTNRRYIVRQSPSGSRIMCGECGEPMLTVEQSAGLFGLTQRRLFQLIEEKAAHYIETETGAALICITSLAKSLDDGISKNHTDVSNHRW